jgi:hypothetical protein
MKKLFASLLLVMLMAGTALAANTLNPTTATKQMRTMDVTFDGATAFDLGFSRLVEYALYMPAAAGNSIQIRDGAATAPRVAYAKSIDGGPQLIYITGAVQIYVVGNQVSNGDILLLRFK